MNKREKEVLQVQLNNEKAILKQLEKNYEDALGEINSKIEILMARQDADMQHVIYQVEYQKALKTQVQAILENLQTNEFETVSEYLAKSYEDGFIGTMYNLQGQGIPLVMPIDQEQVVQAIQHDTQLSEDLYTAMGKDIKTLQRQISGEISRGISTGMMYSEIARNVANYARIPKNNAMRIARTEAHRIQNTASMDACNKAKSKGADVVKQWDAALDAKTRDTHRQLDGTIKELDEPFEVGRHKAMFPGDFGVAAEDINCRCALLQRARWNLGNDYTKWSEDAPVIIDDDGTTQFVIVDANSYKEFKGYYQDIAGQMTMNLSNGNKSRVRKSAQKTKPKVTKVREYTVNGTTYKVDGKHVILKNTENEEKVAFLLSNELKKEVHMIPRVVFPQKVSTPDYVIGDKKYDLKEPTGSGKNVLYNMIKNKKSQANNFVFDISKCPLDYSEIKKQVEGIYSSTHTAFVDEIIIIKDGKIKEKFKKTKKRN